VIPVQDGVVFHVFWKDIKNVGKGPALSLIVGEVEVLRLDCFGPGDGHLHADFVAAGMNAEERLFFPEDTIPAQIERALFELSKNWAYYTTRSLHPHVQKTWLDPNALRKALKEARGLMVEFSGAGFSAG